MWKQIAAGILLSLFASAAFAYSCPGLMSDIDSALQEDAVVSRVSDAKLERVRELRDKGEALHEQGDHDGSEAALNEAKSILGID